MLLQLHQQNIKTGDTIFCAQFAEEDMKGTLRDAHKDFPLPKGYEFLICTEESEHFIKTTFRGNRKKWDVLEEKGE